MATSLVYKVRSSRDGSLIASCALLTDATVVACRHGRGTKLVHMHLGVLATVAGLAAGTERAVFDAAMSVEKAKRQKQRADYERKYGRPA